MSHTIKYSLPKYLRKKLTEPIGFLTDEENLINFLKRERYIVSVGDQVTFTLLNYDIKPVLCIVDYIIKRNEYNTYMKTLIKSFGRESLIVNNPPSVITDELWDAIKKCYEYDLDELSFRIEVNGEEDLAALPAIYMAPLDVTIIYGLPNKGVVVVKSSEVNKQKVREILNKM